MRNKVGVLVLIVPLVGFNLQSAFRIMFPVAPDEMGGSKGIDSTASTDATDYLNITFEDLLKQIGSDDYTAHHYEWAYSAWLAPFRSQPNLKLLEIGAGNDKSMAVWANYFHHPILIQGLAYGENAEKAQAVGSKRYAKRNRDKIRIQVGEETDPLSAKHLCSKGPYHVIIDDGSHVPSHVMISFVRLFPCLQEGGLYVIESVETNYWDKPASLSGYEFHGGGIGQSPKGSVVEKFKQLVEVINRNEFCRDDLSVLPGDGDICELAFHANLIKVVKCTERQKRSRRDACFRWKSRLVDAEKVNKWKDEARSTNIDFGSFNPGGRQTDPLRKRPKQRRNVSIFYNIFVPKEDPYRAVEIVDEQLSFRSRSWLKDSMLYYSRIGELTTAMPDCAPCELLGSYTEGNESLTLTKLHQFCANHEDNLVVYMHDKGSYSAHLSNYILRRLLTHAVMDPTCSSMAKDSGCDVCGARFKPFPTGAYVGNLWAAECSYINKLMSPEEYRLSKLALMSFVWSNANNTEERLMRAVPQHMYWQVERPSWVGVDRFAYEQWVTSHPELRPCDSHNGTWDGGYKHPPWDFQQTEDLQPAPRIEVVKKSLPGEFHPWLSLEGRLYEWQYLYNASPTNGGWPYSTYHAYAQVAQILELPP